MNNDDLHALARKRPAVDDHARNLRKAERRHWKAAAPRIHRELEALHKGMKTLTRKRRIFLDFLKGLRPPQPWYWPRATWVKKMAGSVWSGWHPKYEDADRLRMAAELGMI